MNKHLLSAYCVPSPGSSRGVGTGIGKPQLCLLRRLAFQCHLSHNPRVLHTPFSCSLQFPHTAWNPPTWPALQRKDVSSHTGW